MRKKNKSKSLSEKSCKGFSPQYNTPETIKFQIKWLPWQQFSLDHDQNSKGSFKGINFHKKSSKNLAKGSII